MNGAVASLYAMLSEPAISEVLRARAETSPAAAELEAAAKKLDSFSRAPGTRKQAERVGTVLTSDVVEVLGRAFVDLRTDEIEHPDQHFGSEFREADYAFAGLLIAAADPALQGSAKPALDEVVALLPRMLPDQREHVHYLSGLFPDNEAASAVHAAATRVLEKEPDTEGDVWARELGLGLPKQFWEISLSLEPIVPDWPEDHVMHGHPRRWFEAIIYADISNYPGDGTGWDLRIGTRDRDVLAGTASHPRRGSQLGEYDRPHFRHGESVSGAIVPPEAIADLPRALADLEAAHPELRYNYAKASISGRPGRLLSAAAKKKIIAWLSRA